MMSPATIKAAATVSASIESSLPTACIISPVMRRIRHYRIMML